MIALVPWILMAAHACYPVTPGTVRLHSSKGGQVNTIIFETGERFKIGCLGDCRRSRLEFLDSQICNRQTILGRSRRGDILLIYVYRRKGN